MAPIIERNEQQKTDAEVRFHQHPKSNVLAKPADTPKDAQKSGQKAPVVFTDWASI